jgi:acetyl-CoA/propionyl-CoA carboxylase biotin carboxyl carrier protein
LIVWGPTRQIALHRLRGVLADTGIEGIASTLPALCAVAEHPEFAAGGVSTRWFEQVLVPCLQPAPAGSAPNEVAPEPETGVWIGGRFHRLPVAARDEMGGTARRPRTARSTISGAAARDAVRAAGGGHQVRSPMRATVTAIDVTPGDAVTAGQVLGAVEAMKMEHPLTSPIPGRVLTVQVTVGQLVSTGEVLLVVEPRPHTDHPTEPGGAAHAGN